MAQNEQTTESTDWTDSARLVVKTCRPTQLRLFRAETQLGSRAVNYEVIWSVNAAVDRIYLSASDATD